MSENLARETQPHHAAKKMPALVNAIGRRLRNLTLALVLLSSFASYASEVSFKDAFSPNQGATALVVRTISDAQRSVRVAAYSFTSMMIAEALVSAFNRGVDVKVVLDKRQSKGQGSVLAYLHATGVPVRINTHYAIMHNKFIIVDDEILESGSFNFTQAAEKRNAENVLVIHGAPEVMKDYISQWTKLWNEGG